MLRIDYNSVPVSASQMRVSVKELTEALASLEARKARQDFEQAGTVTLAEAIQECNIAATPEELKKEVAQIRTADARERKIKQRQRRLRFAVISEVVSAILCLLVLLILHHTLFDKNWQQARRIEDFQQMLRLSKGPNPQYNIFVVPESSRSIDDLQATITTFGDWANHPAYPIYSLPDGYNIHHFDGLDDEGHSSIWAQMYLPFSAVYIEFRKPEQPFFRDNVSVFYDGLQYWRGWIRKQDVPKVLQGHAFTLYPALVSSPRYKIDDIIPLTVSMQSIQEAQGQWGQASSDYRMINFPEGSRVHLDQHAWEQSLGSPDK